MSQVIITVQLAHVKLCNYYNNSTKYCQICIKTGQELTTIFMTLLKLLPNTISILFCDLKLDN